jgi:hypothetical protein
MSVTSTFSASDSGTKLLLATTVVIEVFPDVHNAYCDRQFPLGPLIPQHASAAFPHVHWASNSMLTAPCIMIHNESHTQDLEKVLS